MAFRVGVIGCGRMANTIEDEQINRRKQRPYRGGLALPYSHAAGYAAIDETEIVAACDIHEGRLANFVERWNVPAAYTDYREMIEKENLDIVSVTTRPEQHAEEMVFAAEHGVKGVYAEKPLCMSLVETDAIRDAFERNGVHLEYGPIYRHWAAYEQARTIAESGELGEVQSVLGFEGKALEGHFIDLLLYMLGDPEPVSIQGIISQLNPAEGDTSGMKFVQDTSILSALIKFDNGTTAHVAGTGVGREIELVCTNGVHPCCERWRSGADAASRCDIGCVGYGPGRAYTAAERHCLSHQRDLIHSIKTGEPGKSNLRVTLLSQDIGFGIYESHLRGGVPISPPIPNRERWVFSW